MQIFKGCATALVTPFGKNGKINFDEFERLVEFQISNGVDALVFLGTTGEASTMSEREKTQVVDFATSVAEGRVPVIVGAGGNNTAECVKRAKRFAKFGVDGLLQVTPYYNKCTQEGLVAHFGVIAQSVPEVKQVLYNVPGRTGVNMLPETVLEIATQNKNVVGLKEAGGNLQQLTKLFEILPKNHFSVFTGEDENIFTTLALGGQGVISVVSNILPKKTAGLCHKFFQGDFVEARQVQFELLPIARQLFCEVNPIPVKAGLNMLGFQVGVPRLPLTKMTEKNQQKLKELLGKTN